MPSLPWLISVRFRYVVLHDPIGPKIGNGGATLHVIDWLYRNLGDDVTHRA